jgi:ribonuclease HIII
MAIVVFLYVLCICEGLKQLKKMKPSDSKKFKDGTITLTVSIFRKGLAYVHLKFNNLRTFVRYLRTILKHKNLLFLQNVQ